MWEMILNIVLVVLSVGFAFLSYYLDIKKNLLERANGEISKAEDTGKKNAEKMAFVVEQLKKIVPKVMRFIFTDRVIEKIVQKAFDAIEDYASKQNKK
jgi:hypothetical protein